MSSERKFVENLYSQYDMDKEPTQQLAHTINAITFDSLTGEKYIYELLQNANDAANKIKTILEVDFSIFGDYLVFQHDGKSFEQKDVKGISSTANPNREKVEDLESVGHKGIGFKSVFTISDWVYINSNQYTFRFDKRHKHWAERVQDCPWQVIPIWTENNDLPKGIEEVIKNRKVTIVLRLHPDKKVRIIEELKTLMKNSAVLLFLDYVKQINFNCDNVINESLSKELQEKQLSPTEKLQDVVISGMQSRTTWHVYRKNQDIPEAISQILAKSDSVPKKYKVAKHIPISIAMRSEGGRLIPETSDSQLFCYLPTSISFKLPFVANADFFLEMSRAQLKHDDAADPWHGFILGVVFNLQFVLLHHLAKRETFGKSTLPMLATPKKVPYGHLESFKADHQGIFDKAITTLGIVSSMRDPSHLLIVKDAHIDGYRFVEQFGPDSHQDFCVSNDLVSGSREFLRENGASEVDALKIIGFLKEPNVIARIKVPEVNQRLFLFLQKCFQSENHRAQNPFEGLRTSAFVLNEKGELTAPRSDLALPSKALRYATKGFHFLNIVHPTIAALEREVLSTFGLQPITLDAVIAAVNKNPGELIEFTRKVFDRHKSGGLTDEDYKKLELLKIITNKPGVVKASKECYLSNDYLPELALEVMLASFDGFISTEYVKNREQGEFLLWRSFFKRLKVSDGLNKLNIDNFVKAINQHTVEARVQFVCRVVSYYKDRNEFYVTDLDQGMKNVQIVTSAGFFIATECYPSNCYMPDMPLQDLVAKMSYVSDAYLRVGGEITPQEWLGFFKSLGMKDSLSCSLATDVSRDVASEGQPEPTGYIRFLETPANLPHDVNLGGGLYDRATWRYLDQHRISAFIKIEFLANIIESGLFWKVLHDNFNLFRQADSNVMYKTRVSARRVPLNIIYYVNYALRKKYNKTASELYAPSLLNVFTEQEVEELPVADVAGVLTSEEQDFFGFRRQLSTSHALIVLGRISKSVKDESLLTKLTWLYKDIVCGSEAIELLQPCPLLTESGNFVGSDCVVANTSSYLVVSNDESKARVLKKPLGLTNDEFLALCKKLNVNCMTDSNALVKSEEYIVEDSFKDLLRNKLPLLILIDAHSRKVEEHALGEFLTGRINDVLEGLSSLQFFSSSKLVICFDDVIHEEVESWYSSSEKTIYFVDGADPMTQEEISKFIGIALDLRIEPGILYHLLYDKNPERILKRLRNAHLSEENIALSRQLIKEILTLGPPQKKQELQQLESGDEKKHKRQKMVSISGEEDFSSAIAEDSSSSEKSDEGCGEKSISSQRSLGTYSGGRGPFFWSGDNQALKRERKGEDEERKIDAEDDEPLELESEGNNTQVKKVKADGYRQLKIDALTHKQREEVGFAGEDFVYQKLISHYKGKGYTVEENDGGFFAEKEDKKKAILWPNKKLKGKSKEHYDFIISENGKVCYLEVKGSLGGGPGDNSVTLSEDEYKLMEDCSNSQNKKYRIFYVYNLNKVKNGDDPDFIEVKNPLQDHREAFKEKKVYEFRPKF